MTIIRRGREYADEEEYQDERSEYQKPEYYDIDRRDDCRPDFEEEEE